MAMMDSTLDRSIPVPLYFQLKTLLLEDIKNGVYPPGSMIPTENELIDKFGVSRTTVRQTITELAKEGWLYRVKSKGTFVTRPKIRQDFLSTIESYNTEMKRKGLRAATEVLELKVDRAGDDVAACLNISPSDKVVCLYRRRFANDDPIVTIHTYLPDSSCHFVMSSDLANVSLYSELGRSDETHVVQIRRHVEAGLATKEDASLLDVKKGSPLLLTSSIGCNVYGTPIEYSVARYRGDLSAFDVVVAPEDISANGAKA